MSRNALTDEDVRKALVALLETDTECAQLVNACAMPPTDGVGRFDAFHFMAGILCGRLVRDTGELIGADRARRITAEEFRARGWPVPA